MSCYYQLSVFDLDHTLLSTNISYRFGLFLYQKKLLCRSSLIRSLGIYAFHRYFFWLCRQSIHHAIFDICFKGLDITWLILVVRDFFSLNPVFEMLSNTVYRLLKEDIRSNCYTILLSNSPLFLVEPIAKALGFNEWGATVYEHDANKKLTHISKVFNGHTKAEYIERKAQEMMIENSFITAYSDSYSDICLLKKVGNPIAVRPDKILRLFCYKNRWKIIE